MRQNYECFNLYVWYLFFFDIYVEEYIYKDLTKLKNDAKYKETYWKAFDQISHLSIFLDIKTIVEIHEITNGKSVKIVPYLYQQKGNWDIKLWWIVEWIITKHDI